VSPTTTSCVLYYALIRLSSHISISVRDNRKLPFTYHPSRLLSQHFSKPLHKFWINCPHIPPIYYSSSFFSGITLAVRLGVINSVTSISTLTESKHQITHIHTHEHGIRRRRSGLAYKANASFFTIYHAACTVRYSGDTNAQILSRPPNSFFEEPGSKQCNPI